MITAHQLEVRAGARLLMEDVSFRIAAGDKVGLVGRNGAGKTTLTRILAGEGLPAAGKVPRTGEVGYLPQDPRIGDPEVLARDRILSARGLDDVVRRLREAEDEMASDDPDDPRARHEALDPGRRRAARRWRVRRRVRGRADRRSLGIEERILAQPLRPSPVASAAGWSSPGSCSPAPRRCCSTSPPTTSTPTRSSGCATSSRRHRGGLVVISHDNALLEATRQQGLPPRRQPRRDRRLQHGLEELPHPA